MLPHKRVFLGLCLGFMAPSPGFAVSQLDCRLPFTASKHSVRPLSTPTVSHLIRAELVRLQVNIEELKTFFPKDEALTAIFDQFESFVASISYFSGPRSGIDAEYLEALAGRLYLVNESLKSLTVLLPWLERIHFPKIVVPVVGPEKINDEEYLHDSVESLLERVIAECLGYLEGDASKFGSAWIEPLRRLIEQNLHKQYYHDYLVSIALGRLVSDAEMHSIRTVIADISMYEGDDGIRPSLPGNYSKEQFRMLHRMLSSREFSKSDVSRLLSSDFFRGKYRFELQPRTLADWLTGLQSSGDKIGKLSELLDSIKDTPASRQDPYFIASLVGGEPHLYTKGEVVVRVQVKRQIEFLIDSGQLNNDFFINYTGSDGLAVGSVHRLSRLIYLAEQLLIYTSHYEKTAYRIASPNHQNYLELSEYHKIKIGNRIWRMALESNYDRAAPELVSEAHGAVLRLLNSDNVGLIFKKILDRYLILANALDLEPIATYISFVAALKEWDEL